MRVLLVEDDNQLADGLKESLRHEGYSIDHVSNGTNAISANKTN